MRLSVGSSAFAGIIHWLPTFFPGNDPAISILLILETSRPTFSAYSVTDK
nr:MAG TPA: hypothetical protein [Caudoviricetes sp.]